MRRRKRRSRSRIRIKKEPKAVRRRVVRKCHWTVGISIWLRTVGIRIRFITVLPCCGRPFSTASAAGSSRGEEALHSKSVYASLGPC